MIVKLGMEHYELKLYTVCINDVPDFTLTYFTAMSNLAKHFCTYSRPRYQVSVYRTIGPLVVGNTHITNCCIHNISSLQLEKVTDFQRKIQFQIIGNITSMYVSCLYKRGD